MSKSKKTEKKITLQGKKDKVTKKDKETVVENPVVEVVEDTEVPEVVESPDEKKPKGKKEEKEKEAPVVEVEVVNPEPEPEEEQVERIANRLYDKDDRIDANHQIDLMKMVHTEYVTNPNAHPNVQVAMKKQFDAMALQALMRYNAQVESDFQTLGIKVNNTLGVQMEKMARELYGITLKGLPSPDDPNQKVINFGEIPEPVKKEIKQDIKAEKKKIPEPDPKMSESDKISAIESIFAQMNQGGIGNNLLNGIQWARRAYSFTDTADDSTILANLFSKNIGGTLPRCMRSMVLGKMNAEHSILGVHSLMKAWLPSVADDRIANIVRVITSYAIENRAKEFDERAKNANKPYKGDITNEFSIVNKNITIGCNSKVIEGIIKHTESVVVENINIPTQTIRKTVECAYGDSDSIIKDKLNEIAEYYTKPIMRLSDYAKANN